MTDQNVPNPDQPEVPATADQVPTEALQLADQQPVTVAASEEAAAQRPRAQHTRTILEVVGGVVAAGLILAAGAVGFVVGHATSDGDVRVDRAFQQWDNGPEAGAPGMGQGQGQRGRHHDDQGFGLGVEPHGDNGRGQGRGQGGPGMGNGDGDNGTARQDGTGNQYGPQDDSTTTP